MKTGTTVLAILLVLSVLLGQEHIARNQMENMLTKQGYKNIVLGNWRTDPYGFEATSPTGEKVTGYVTRGYHMDYSLKFNK